MMIIKRMMMTMPMIPQLFLLVMIMIITTMIKMMIKDTKSNFAITVTLKCTIRNFLF